MMTATEIKNLISQGETTTVQFKIRTEDAYRMGVEMVAFSNSQGGKLIIGVNDKNGAISGLSFEEIQATNALLSNAASENVKPAIVISTETINIDGQNIVIANIAQGKNKPYKDNKGIIWVKNGSDKRKVFSNSELRVMMQSCGNLFADKDSVEGTSFKDISLPTLKTFLYKRYTKECEASGIIGASIQTSEVEDIVKAIDVNFTVGQLLHNISLMDAQGQLTLSGLLLLGKSIQRYKPVFTLKCISFVGNSMATTEFRDKMPDGEMEGNLQHQYNAAISFINRNLKSVQVEKEFNSLPRLEIPLEVFVETLTNALIHRDYYQNAPVRLFIFDNRIEIISPGILPDSVTVESIKQGISKPRNQLLFDNAKYLLPYTGIGSGIVRAMKNYNHITFKNDYVREEFIITAVRQELPEGYVYVENVSDYDANYDEEKSDYDKGKSVIDGVQDGGKSVIDDAKSVRDGVIDDVKSVYDEEKSVRDDEKSVYDEEKSVYDGVHDEEKSVYDDVKSVHDEEKSVYDEEKSVHDGVYDEEKSVHDGVYDERKSVYDEKILNFTLTPKHRKEIMDLLGLTTHTKNYERHIAPLLEKGLLAMTLPDKPKSKNQKYITTEKGKRLINSKIKHEPK